MEPNYSPLNGNASYRLKTTLVSFFYCSNNGESSLFATQIFSLYLSHSPRVWWFFPSPAPSLFLAFFSDTYFRVNMDLILFMVLQSLWKKWLQLSKVVYMYKEHFKFSFLLLWSLVSIGEIPLLLLRHFFFSLGSSMLTSLMYLSVICSPFFMSDPFREKRLDFIHRN